MGGKDFILVDETADLEEAAKGVVAAAFGFQGQKCSACSRLIVHEKVHDELLAKVVEKTKASEGRRRPRSVDRGGRRDQRAGAEKDPRVRRRSGRKEGKIVAGGTAGPGRRLLRDADGRRRRQALGAAREGGDLRAGARRPEGQELRRRDRGRQRLRTTA